MDWKDGKTHSLSQSSNFLYLCVFVLTIYLHLHLSKHVYKLTCYIIQINEATSYEKSDIGSFFKQLFNKISLEIIILLRLYGQPEQRDRKRN